VGATQVATGCGKTLFCLSRLASLPQGKSTVPIADGSR
jgi:hypothetical protein